MTTFSTPTLFITIMERFTYFPCPWPSAKVVKLSQRAALPSVEASSCLAARTDKAKLAVSLRDTWKWLMEESSSRLMALRIVMGNFI